MKETNGDFAKNMKMQPTGKGDLKLTSYMQNCILM